MISVNISLQMLITDYANLGTLSTTFFFFFLQNQYQKMQPVFSDGLLFYD